MKFTLGLKKYPEIEGGEPVLVIWDDAWSNTTVGGPKERLFETASKKHLRYQVGWLVGKDADHLVMASTCDPPSQNFIGTEPEYEDVTRIRRSMVEKVIPLCSLPSKSRSTRPPRSSSPESSPSPSASEPSCEVEAPLPSTAREIAAHGSIPLRCSKPGCGAWARFSGNRCENHGIGQIRGH